MKKNNMVKRIKRSAFLRSILYIILILAITLSIIIYFRVIDRKAKKITEEAIYTYKLTKKIDNSNGFFVANVKDDLYNYVKKHKKVNSIIYRIVDEDVYFLVNINKSKDDFKIDITKISDDKKNISARMTYKDVKKIEYKTGGSNNATVLNIITEFDNKYVALIKDNYYFLGTDVDEVGYSNDHFYYYTINKNYNVLRYADSCSDNVIIGIEAFNYWDNYYNYGVINFLNDYYQKLAPSSYSVMDRCNYLYDKLLENQAKESKEEE